MLTISPSVITVSRDSMADDLVEDVQHDFEIRLVALMGRRRCRPIVRARSGRVRQWLLFHLPASSQRTCDDPACHAHLLDDLRCLHPRLAALLATVADVFGARDQLGTGRVGDSTPGRRGTTRHPAKLSPGGTGRAGYQPRCRRSSARRGPLMIPTRIRPVNDMRCSFRRCVPCGGRSRYPHRPRRRSTHWRPGSRTSSEPNIISSSIYHRPRNAGLERGQFDYLATWRQPSGHDPFAVAFRSSAWSAADVTSLVGHRPAHQLASRTRNP